MEKTSIHKHFESLSDPRLNRTKKHALINVVFIALCAVICGAEDWASIERFGHMKLKWLSQFLDLSNGIPSHDTFSRVFSLIDSSAFGKCFIFWVEGLTEKIKKILAVDGKSMRGTRSQKKDLGALHLVNVWCCENQLVLGQEKVSDKSNEITAIPKLLELLDISGSIITIDAMGCQKEICQLIKEKKADYVISLKGNQGNLHKDVELYFDSLHAGQFKTKANTHSTIEKDHGRVEERNFFSVSLPKGLHSEGWEGLKSIAMVRSKRTINGVESTENRYFISSLMSERIKDIAHAVRAHWGVENGLHWRLDVSFNEDGWRAREGNSAENMALINKMALNLLKKEPTAKLGVKNRRLMAAWDENYLSKVLIGEVPKI
jgi:predicted transposase YbfD/YdcC